MVYLVLLYDAGYCTKNLEIYRSDEDHRTVTILMLHKLHILHIGSKNEVILSKICGKYELN